MERRFNSYNAYFTRIFGGRVQKISIDAGFSCPNRDGKISTGGCSFCRNDAFNPYGMIVSSNAYRLKPLAIDVRVQPDTVSWFLNDKDDIRSSCFLEDVATEFDVQGLELDWSCVVWDGDFRYTHKGWTHHSFCGDKWQNINKPERKVYQKNAYRVLLTRARQGMVIVVPEGNINDPTRSPEFYNSTYEYLKSLGIIEI